MSDVHDVPPRKSDEEFKQEAPHEAVGGLSTDSSREQEARPDVDAEESELRQTIRNSTRRLAEIEKELAEIEGGCFGRFLIESVYVVILIVTVSAWTVLGFAVWLPLLVRTTTILAGTVLYANLFRDQPRVVLAQRSVNFAVRFYVKGFEHFLIFYRQRHEPDQPVGLFEPLTAMKWKELLIECAWVLVVWAATYFVVRSLIMVLFGA